HVAQLAGPVLGMAVTLQLDGDDLSVSSESGEQVGKAAVDRAHGTVEQHQWPSGAVELVVHPEAVDQRVPARVISSLRTRLRGGPPGETATGGARRVHAKPCPSVERSRTAGMRGRRHPN